MLPESVLNRPRAEFREGAGVADMTRRNVSDTISREEFAIERVLPSGGTLNAKEELSYDRIFKDHFRKQNDLSFVGRTKGPPVA